MDLKTVKTFQLIAACGSFHRAAQELNYAQSTVTMQIQKLESELGVQLFERGKVITLTEAGRLLYEQSLPILKQMEQLQNSLTELTSGEAGHIRIGVTEPTASCRLPALLKSFMSQHPKIRISIEIASTPVLAERILRGDIDFAICTTPDMGSELYFEPLFQEEFVALLPEHHPLARSELILPENWRRHRLLVTSEACPYRRKLEMVLQEQGIADIATMEIGSMSALKSYVENGFGIALVPRIMAEPVTKGTTVRRIGGSLIHMTCGLLCKESAYPLSQASRKLYTCVRQGLSDDKASLFTKPS